MPFVVFVVKVRKEDLNPYAEAWKSTLACALFVYEPRKDKSFPSGLDVLTRSPPSPPHGRVLQRQRLQFEICCNTRPCPPRK